MAREQRKDVDYFPHDCTHGRKMHIIETKYGNDGYATWFKLLEQLGKANNHYIDFSEEMTLMFLTSIFKIDEERTISILTDLSKLGAIDKFLFDEYKIIWSEKFCNSIEDAYRKRKQKLFLKEDILALKNPIPRGNSSIPRGMTEKTTENIKKDVNKAESIPKVKYSKVKYSKVKESKEESKSHSGEKTPVEDSTKFWKLFVAKWFEFYKSKFEAEPTFNASNAKSLKSIVLRFEKLSKSKETPWNEITAIKTFDKFLNNAWEDDWIKQNFLLNNLYSKFDSIINKIPIQNGKKFTNTTKSAYKFDVDEIQAQFSGS